MPRAFNDYVFERAVSPRDSADTHAPPRIDLYKKGCFILEAKQSRLPGKNNAIPNQGNLALDEPDQLGRRSVAKGWDVMMQNARRQKVAKALTLSCPPRRIARPAARLSDAPPVRGSAH